MAKQTKRSRLAKEIFGAEKLLDFTTAVVKFQDLAARSKSKLIESLDLAINLGIDARKGEQMVRGMFTLPVSTEREVRIAVFAEGDAAKQATSGGALSVGMEELAESMKQGNIDYDLVIAVPEAMKLVGQLGRQLGPKGLMPNPKDGTVTKDVAAALKAAKAGQVRLRNDKQGIIHCSIGKLDTKPEDLEKNFIAVVGEIRRLKPKTSKGTYLKKITLSSTMGPGVQVNIPAG